MRTVLLFGVSVTAYLALSIAVNAQVVPSESDGDRQFEELERIYASRTNDSATTPSYEDIRGRDAWFHYQRSYPFAHIPATGRVDALRVSEKIERALLRSRAQNGKGGSLFSASQWEPIGPTNQGGRIRAVAIHPTEPSVYLLGAAAGGVWKTTDDAGSWLPTFDNESAIAVGSIAFDHSNPLIVYAGTGENFPSSPTLLTNTPSYLGNGVFKSTDEGLTWLSSGLESAGAVSKLFVHRQNPSIVYAAVAKQNGGFYRSSDAGATWTRTASGDLYDMAVNPANSDEVYAAHPNNIRKSTDGGLTFADANTGITTSAGIRFSVALAESDPARLYVLAARGGGSGGGERAEIYGSTNGGGTWKLLASLGESFFNNQGVYDNFISVHPRDPDIVLAGGIDVYRSTNGGAQWENTTRVYSGGSVHPDQHTATFSPSKPNTVLLGNDGGLFASGDAGANWIRESDGLAITQFYRMEVDQTRPFRVYGGTQDNGTSGSFSANSFSGNWTNVLGGDGFFVVADKGDPNWFYAEIYYGTLYRINANNPEQRQRIDGGIPSSGAAADGGNWATPIAMSPIDKALYSGRTNLWRTLNRGQNWTKIPTGIISKIAAIGLSPSDAKKIIVGGVTGGIRYSTDYGVTWDAGIGVPNSVVTDLRFDPIAPNRAYATFSGFGTAHVFRTDDNGAAWTDITANLPRIPVNAIEIDPLETSRLFIATDVGVFFSPNSGEFWIPFNPGLPLAPISDLEIHRSSHALLAATHGRSMYRISLDGIVIEPTLVTPLGGERITTPGDLEVRWIGFDGPVNVSIKYSANEAYQRVASNVSESRVTIPLPMRVSTTARIRVEEISTGRTVTSGFLTLVTPSNATALGRRGFTAEAIELRGTTLWATSRGSDTIRKLRLPLVTGNDHVVRCGFSGTIRDLAYDASSDNFFALVTEDDFSTPQIYRMDTTGASLGALTLPAALGAAVGIAMRDGDLAVMTPGPNPTLWLLDPTTGVERSHVMLDSAAGAQRRALIWNGQEYLQGVMFDSTSDGFNSELQQITATEPVRVMNRIPIVLPSGSELRFFGLAFDPGVSGTTYYIGTDTAGTFFRFRADIVGAADHVRDVGVGSTVLSVRVVPNPAVESAVVELELNVGGSAAVEIVDASGLVVATVASQRAEAGVNRIAIQVRDLPSGIYYVVAQIGTERVIRAFSVVR